MLLPAASSPAVRTYRHPSRPRSPWCGTWCSPGYLSHPSLAAGGRLCRRLSPLLEVLPAVLGLLEARRASAAEMSVAEVDEAKASAAEVSVAEASAVAQVSAAEADFAEVSAVEADAAEAGAAEKVSAAEAEAEAKAAAAFEPARASSWNGLGASSESIPGPGSPSDRN